MRKSAAVSTRVLLVVYILWAISMVVGLAAALVLRPWLVKLYILFMPNANPWAIGVIDKTVVILLVLAWIVLAGVCEVYYRRGAAQGRLLVRFGLVTFPAALVVSAGFALGVYM